MLNISDNTFRSFLSQVIFEIGRYVETTTLNITLEEKEGYILLSELEFPLVKILTKVDIQGACRVASCAPLKDIKRRYLSLATSESEKAWRLEHFHIWEDSYNQLASEVDATCERLYTALLNQPKLT